MAYYNLQIIYNYTISSKAEEQLILSHCGNAGKSLERLPCFEVKEIKRQSKTETLSDVSKS